MEEDWDLHAVVRSFTASSSSSSSSSSAPATAAAAPSTTSTDLAPLVPVSCSSFGVVKKDEGFFSPPDSHEARHSSLAELHELYKPFFPKPEPLVFRNAAVSALPPPFGGVNGQPMFRQQPNPANTNGSAAASSSSSCTTSSQPQPSRSKRRKSQLKKVCHVPAESLSSDIWAWRKYGQKPIKGSPYPRGYYRCSSSKGCLARKQVERNRSDPGMFIVTYTAEHNHPAPTHRNSLAGSTRQKPTQKDTVEDPSAAASTKPPCSSPTTSAEDEAAKTQSPNTESREEKEGSMADDEEDGEVGLSDMALSDDFFVGLEGLPGGGDDEDCFLDRFPANFGHSWTANDTATATDGS